MTSAMPSPVRETTAAAQPARARARRPSRLALLGAAGAVRGPAAGGGSLCEVRQISAPPAATSTTGQVTQSENHATPLARTASRPARTRKPEPSATSTAPRRVRRRRALGAVPSSGSSAQPSA